MDNRSLSYFLFAFQGRMTRKEYWLNYGLPRYGIYIGFLILLGVAGWVLGTFGYFFAIADADSSGAPLPAPSGLQILGFVVLAIMILAFTVFWVWSGIAGTVKRFHDCNQTGWLTFILIVPYVGIFVVWIWNGFIKGTVGENKYGFDPNGSVGEVSDVFE